MDTAHCDRQVRTDVAGSGNIMDSGLKSILCTCDHKDHWVRVTVTDVIPEDVKVVESCEGLWRLD